MWVPFLGDETHRALRDEGEEEAVPQPLTLATACCLTSPELLKSQASPWPLTLPVTAPLPPCPNVWLFLSAQGGRGRCLVCERLK